MFKAIDIADIAILFAVAAKVDFFIDSVALSIVIVPLAIATACCFASFVQELIVFLYAWDGLIPFIICWLYARKQLTSLLDIIEIAFPFIPEAFFKLETYVFQSLLKSVILFLEESIELSIVLNIIL